MASRNTGLLHQSIAATPVIANEFTQGIGWGWISPTLHYLQNSKELSVSTSELSWLGSAQEIGRMTGPLNAALLIDRIGRKSMIVTCALLSFLSWIVIGVSNSVLHICAARLIFGFSSGMNEVNSSIYLGENFSPKLRAIFCSVALVAFYFAELVEYVIASMFHYKVVAYCNASIAFLVLLSTYLSKETPQYLLMMKNYGAAEKNYSWLNGFGNTEEVGEEFQNIKQNVEEEKEKIVSYRKLLASRANYRSLIINCLLYSFTVATGGTAVISYVTILFQTNEILTPYQFTILFGFVRLLVSISLPFYIERLGRRTVILVSFFLVTIMHLCTAALYYVHQNVIPIAHISWYVFFTITVYASIHTILSPTSAIIRGELYPQSVKALGGFMAVSLHSVVGFFALKTFLVIKSTYGVHVNFLLYGIMGFIAFLYNYFQLPETKGKTLIEIQKALEKCE